MHYQKDILTHSRKNKNPLPEIYQFRIWLKKISPSIWRRILICDDSTVSDLHYTLQIAMGWTDTYLHEFKIHGKRYGITKEGGISFPDNPHKILLKDLRFRLNQRFIYEYNFNSNWEHEIRFEKVLPFDLRKTYPVCTGGTRSAPPEDCGGPLNFLILKQKYSYWYIEERILEFVEEGDLLEHFEEFHSMKYWLEVDKFNRRAVNRRLKQYGKGDQAWIDE